MAEIKSTMQLVLERAARMGVASADELHKEDSQKKGMQLAADYLANGEADLAKLLQAEPAESQKNLREGMITSLLRNLFLPRDEDGEKRLAWAMQGLIELNKTKAEVASLCEKLKGIIGQYSQHRSQLYEQLKEQLRAQIQQILAREASGARVDASKIDPTVEPRFKEEWARLEGELNSQYGQAIEQYRMELRKLAGV